jgi:hypothetical protein
VGGVVLDAPKRDAVGPQSFIGGIRTLAVPVLVVVANVLVLYGFRVPHSNEYVYLLRLRATHDPSFLSQDWTFTRSFNEHFLFNAVVSPVTGVASVELIGWVGRVACWTVLAWLILRFAGDLGVRRWPATVALIVWLPCQSRLVGADWLFGTFEAKPLAYICLFAALLATTSRRVPAAMLLAGLTLSLHPGVGIWASGPLVLALVWWSPTRAAALRWSWLALVAAAPGVVSTLVGLGDTAASARVWDFVVHQLFPYHLDPFYFGVANVALLGAMFGFNLWWAHRRGGDLDGLLVRFQVLMAVPPVVGVAAYGIGADELLKYVPFRVFPVLVSLLCFFNLADAWQRRAELRPQRDSRRSAGLTALALVVAMAFAIVVVWKPPKLYASSARDVYRDWDTETDDRQATLRWVAGNVPEDAVVVLPPGPQDTYYLAERAQIANSKAVSWDDIAGWFERMEALAPGFTELELVGSEDEADLDPLYEGLTEDQILALGREYDATYVVTPTDYGLRIVHRVGEWKVYELPPPE